MFAVTGEVPTTARMVLDRVAAATGQLQDLHKQLSDAPRSPTRNRTDGPKRDPRPANRPTLFGHLKRIPKPLAILADVITVGLFVAAAATWIFTMGSGGGHSSRDAHSRSSASAMVTRTTSFHNDQIEGGDIFRIADLSRPSQFSQDATSYPCDLLLYRIRLYNPGGETATKLHLQVDISNEQFRNNTAVAVATSPNIDPSSTTAFATVRFRSPHSLTYVARTTQLLDQNDHLIDKLADGITIGGVGVSVGDLRSGETKVVQFEMKVSCS